MCPTAVLTFITTRKRAFSPGLSALLPPLSLNTAGSSAGMYLLDERPRVQLVSDFGAFGTETPTFERFGHEKMKRRGHFENNFADGFRTSGLS